MITKKRVTINLVSFYIAWWSILISYWKGFIVWGWLVLFIVLASHFFFVSINKKKDLIEVLSIAGLGIVLDTLLFQFKILNFNESLFNFLPPLWLIGIWCLFATTISYSFILLRNRIPAQVLVGGFFAPISYITGAKFSLLSVHEPFPTYYVIHGACWLIFFPLCFAVSKKIKGY